jgi:hypothetical protein
MTVGRMSVICWTVFVVMCFGFLPAIAGIYYIQGLPGPVRLGLAIFVVVVWWGPFGYGMYLSQVAMGNNDRRLLTRGIPGTALVLEAKTTNMTINSGGFDWEGKQVYRYRLRVTVPGREPYETYCRITAFGIREGDTVKVAVAPHNRKRVTIDVSQHQTKPDHPAMRTYFTVHPAQSWPIVDDRIAQDGIPDFVVRLQQLAELARLHKEGSLTDAEFAAEKARLLG